jgi:fluoroquinolone resistance protein
MDKIYTEEEDFNQMDFTEKNLPLGDYENCSFTNCDFSNTNLANINFVDTVFTGCNWSMVKLTNTGLKNCSFIDCKLVGVHFEDCSKFLLEMKFENCILHLASFYKLILKKIVFKNTNMQEVDCTETDFTNAIFENCDLANAVFYNTNLEKADLRTAFNYSISPAQNKIKKAKFSLPSVIGLLNDYDIAITY